MKWVSRLKGKSLVVLEEHDGLKEYLAKHRNKVFCKCDLQEQLLSQTHLNSRPESFNILILGNHRFSKLCNKST